jgi:hypothetical protein
MRAEKEVGPRRTRPGPTRSNLATDDFGSILTQSTDRQRWARRMIDAANGPVPSYGSPEWLTLPDGDVRKVAAVVVAAECWATDPELTWVEALYAATAHKATEDADYHARAETHREEWGHLRPRKSAYADQEVS